MPFPGWTWLLSCLLPSAIYLNSPQISTQHTESPPVLSHLENTVAQQILQQTLEAVLRLSLDEHEHFQQHPHPRELLFLYLNLICIFCEIKVRFIQCAIWSSRLCNAVSSDFVQESISAVSFLLRLPLLCLRRFEVLIDVPRSHRAGI